MAKVLFLIHIPFDERERVEIITPCGKNAESTNEKELKENVVAEGSKDTSETETKDDTDAVTNSEDNEQIIEIAPEVVENDEIEKPQPEVKPKVPKKLLNRYISYDITEVVVSILNRNQISRASWQSTEDKECWQIMFPLESSKSDEVLNQLLTAGIGNNSYSSISVLPIAVNFPAMIQDQLDDESEQKAHKKDQFFQSVKSRLTVAQVIDVVRSGTQLTFDYIILIIMASLIAAVGLLENSSVLLVASMLVSPLMGPILGGTFGIVLRYKTLWKPGIIHELLGLGICLLVGFIFGLVCGLGVPGWSTVTDEMASRGAPRSLIIGVVVAIPSGAGVALSILGGNTGSLVGVAISASLLPPAVNAGICWAYALISTTGQKFTTAQKKTYSASHLAEIGGISMTLTLVNIAIIFIMGVLVLKLKEVAPHTGTAITKSFWKKDLKTTRDYLSGHAMGLSNKPIGDELIDELSKIHDIDLSNRNTIKKSVQGTRLANELTKLLNAMRTDPTYTAVNSNLPAKAEEFDMKLLMKKLQPEPELNRFQIKKAYNLGDTTFHSNSRFMINKLDEEDEAIAVTSDAIPLMVADSTTLHDRKRSKISIQSSLVPPDIAV